jgi:hypothetical protein
MTDIPHIYTEVTDVQGMIIMVYGFVNLFTKGYSGVIGMMHTYYCTFCYNHTSPDQLNKLQ